MNVRGADSRILYLFPDTNLFIQCRSLRELPWSALGEFEEIHLVVCRPVQREIDSQKYRGNDRVADRARKTYGLFREIIASGLDHRVVSDGRPVVKLYLDSLLPNPDLRDRLDYSKPDDEVVGCLDTFQRHNQDKTVYLLTHDGGPMMTAKSLNIHFMPIEDNWLLPPENNKTERELIRVKDRLAQIEEAEPRFHLTCVDEQGKELNSLEVEYVVYNPLAESDVAALVQSLESQFPPSKDFGSREFAERQTRGVLGAFGAKGQYVPASDEAIAEYTNQYAHWIEESEHILATLHDEMQRSGRQLVLTFVGANIGSRPGRAVLVQFRAKGDVQICVPLEDDERIDEEGMVQMRLPSPPQPPQGRWQPFFLVPGILSGALRSQLLIERPTVTLPFSPADHRRDPNAFYFKGTRPMDPVDAFGMECEQWRHGLDDERFMLQVSVDCSEDKISGVVECTIHAENLSEPLKRVIPVRIDVKRVSVGNEAERLIGDLHRLGNR